MRISAGNLSEAVEAGHRALFRQHEHGVSADEKRHALLNAAGLLCAQLKIATGDDGYWQALESETPHAETDDLRRWIGDLAADKDNRRTDLATLFRLVGYRPPDEADEVVRGLVVAIQAGVLLGHGQHADGNAGPGRGMRLGSARMAFTHFADRFCSAEDYLKKSLAAAASESVKKSLTDTLTRTVKAGIAGCAMVFFGMVAIPVAEELSPEVHAVICQHADFAPDTMREMISKVFCAMPTDIDTPEQEQARLDPETRRRYEMFSATCENLDGAIAASTHRTRELGEAERQAAENAAMHERLRQYAKGTRLLPRKKP